jgi:sugar phosphate isomerase/epimerase
MQENWKDAVQKLQALAGELGMQFVQAHSQGGNPLTDDPAHVDFLLKATLRSIEICEMLGIKNTVVHNRCRVGLSKEAWFAENKAFYEKLLPTAERCGVNILCENSTASNMGVVPGYASGDKRICSPGRSRAVMAQSSQAAIKVPKGDVISL